MTDLSQLAGSLEGIDDGGPLPVDTWHPVHCGQMDMVIKSDGTWWHEGTLINRPPLVRLFSRILRRDPDGYVLVTPVEKVSIQVEDVPFLAVDYERREDDWFFRTNVGDSVRLDAHHPLEIRMSDALGHRAPYIHVRGGLEARLARPAYYRLVMELDDDAGGSSEDDEDSRELTITSGGATFALSGGDDAP